MQLWLGLVVPQPKSKAPLLSLLCQHFGSLQSLLHPSEGMSFTAPCSLSIELLLPEQQALSTWPFFPHRQPRSPAGIVNSMSSTDLTLVDHATILGRRDVVVISTGKRNCLSRSTLMVHSWLEENGLGVSLGVMFLLPHPL